MSSTLRSRAKNSLASFVAIALCSSGISFAVWAKAPGASSGGSGDDHRSFTMTLPLVRVGRTSSSIAEYNLANEAALGLEVQRINPGEEFTEEHMAQTGEFMHSNAWQASVLMSRYSNESSMSGFFWTLGVGYRQESVSWYGKPEGTSEGSASALRLSLMDDKGKLYHELEMSGAVGQGRLGWRYVAKSFPMLAGIAIGVCHFDANIKDIDAANEDSEYKSSPTSSSERGIVRRRVMTSPEINLEIGFAL